MSVSYNVSVINDRLQVVADAINAGAGGGLIKIGTAGMGVVLLTTTLLNPCASIAAGVLTILGTPLVAIAAFNGTAATAQITDSNGTIIASGLTVGIPGGTEDIIISNGLLSTVITSGQIVSLLSGTITGS